MEDGRALFVQDPSFASRGDTVVLVGMPTVVHDTATGAASHGALGAIMVRDKARPIPLPSPDTRPWYPVGLLDSLGTLHVLWAEADDTMPAHPVLKRLRYARYARGQWSAAETVLAASSIAWEDAQFRSAHIVGGTLHVLALAGARDAEQLTLLSRTAGGSWQVTAVPTPSPSLYAGLSPDRAGRLLVTYVANDWNRIGERMALWVTESDNGGGRWANPARVHGGRGAAFNNSVTRLHQTGGLRAAWLQRADSTEGDSVIVEDSVPGKARWERVGALSLAGPSVVQFFFDERGTVNVLALYAKATGWLTTHQQLSAGRWTACPVPSLPRLAFTHAGSDGSRLMMTLSSQRTTSSGATFMQTSLSSFSPARNAGR